MGIKAQTGMTCLYITAKPLCGRFERQVEETGWQYHSTLKSADSGRRTSAAMSDPFWVQGIWLLS